MPAFCVPMWGVSVLHATYRDAEHNRGMTRQESAALTSSPTSPCFRRLVSMTASEADV